VNTLPAGWSATESTYLDANNAAFALSTLLAQETFTAAGTRTDATRAFSPLTAPYSLTVLIEISSNGFPSASGSGIGLSSVISSPNPVPGAIYLFGSVLGGAFWLGRRKRSAVSVLTGPGSA
jgi:hypothetical protein